MPSLRLRLGSAEILLVRPRDVLHVRDPEEAQRVAEAVFGASPPPEHVRQAEALVRELVSGEAVLVREGEPLRRLDAPRVEPLLPVDPDPVVDEVRPTWISVELVHEAGTSLEGLALDVTLADGREARARLDSAGRWRSDEVPRGSCELRVLDDERLRAQRRVIGPPGTAPAERLQWTLGSTRALRLPTMAHHRIVVVEDRRFVFSA